MNCATGAFVPDALQQAHCSVSLRTKSESYLHAVSVCFIYRHKLSYANMPFILNAQSASNNHFPVFSDILNTRLKIGKIENLPEVCACLAGRFLASPDGPAEQLSISLSGESRHVNINFTDIWNDPSLTPETCGEVVLKRIAENIAPALMMNGADEVAAYTAALEIAAQLGDPEFATLDQSAIQKAMNNQMSGLPFSGTHIVLSPHGEVMVHKMSQWAGYINKTKQEIRASDGPPILKTGFITTFWLERTDSCIQRAVNGIRKLFGNVGGTKHFELHGKVQRCLLETPDGELKTTLTRNTSSFIDVILNGLARIFGLAGIRIEPPDQLENTLWESTSPKLRDFPCEAGAMQLPPSTILEPSQRRIQAFRSGRNKRSGSVKLTVTTDASGFSAVKSQAIDGSPTLVSGKFEKRNREIQAATTIQRAFGIHVTQTVTQASDGLRALLHKMSATQIKSNADLHIGDIIVVAPAQNGLQKHEWYKHGFVYQITKISVDKFCGDQLHLSANIGRNAKIFSLMPFTEYYQGRDSEGRPLKTPVTSQIFFASERNIEHEITKLNHLAKKGVVYKMDPAVSFTMIEYQFKKTAENNPRRSYSRQNNCNHAIYTTLSALHITL